MTPQEALDRITALCSHPDRDLLMSAVEVRAILAEVRPEPGGVLDRNALLRVLGRIADGLGIPYPTGEVADRIIAECVRPVEATG